MTGDGVERHSSLFEALRRPALAYSVDAEPTVTAVNDAVTDTAGTDPAVGDDVADALRSLGVEAPVATGIQAAATRGEFVERTTVLGREEYRHTSIRVLPGEDGTDGFIVVDPADPDARAERLETFARAVSHDLRNPLDVARIRTDAAEETGESVHFQKVRAAHDRIQRIASDVLFLTDPSTSLDVASVDLESVVEAAWDTVDTVDATLVVDDVPPIEADRERLQRLLENLFRNAVVHGGASVQVTVGATEDGFYVADDGSGFDGTATDRLFEPGQSDNGSTGLGLTVIRQIARSHGWTVEPDEGGDGGARFTFRGVDRATGSRGG